MSSRTLTHRNFIGALFGGIAGIFTFAMISEWLLPVGLLLGVVTGFWYDVIFERCTKQFFADLAAVFLAAGPLLGIMYLLWLWQGSEISVVGDFIIFYSNATFAYLAVLTLWFCSKIANPSMNRQFGTMPVWKYIRTRAILYVLAPAIVLQAIVTLSLCAISGLAYLVVAGTILPSAIILRNTVRVMSRSEHWTCLTVTLITTGLCALSLHPSVDNQVVLWIVALVAGMLSGLLTITVQHYVAPYFSTKRPFQYWMQFGTFKGEWKKRWAQLALFERLASLTFAKQAMSECDRCIAILWPKEPKPENG